MEVFKNLSCKENFFFSSSIVNFFLVKKYLYLLKRSKKASLKSRAVAGTLADSWGVSFITLASSSWVPDIICFCPYLGVNRTFLEWEVYSPVWLCCFIDESKWSSEMSACSALGLQVGLGSSGQLVLPEWESDPLSSVQGSLDSICWEELGTD